MRQRGRVLFMTAGLSIFIIAGCGKKDPVLARIGNEMKITESDFRQSYRQFTKGESREDDLKKLRSSLDNLIDTKLILSAAYQAKFDQDSSVLAVSDESEKTAAIQKLYDFEIVDKCIKESDLRDYYAKTGKQVTIRTIFLEFDPTDSVEIELKKRDAQSLLKKLKNGEAFELLASRHSDDRKTAIKGGLVGTLKYTKPGDPVQEAAFTMKEGETSGILESQNGFNIIKIDKVESVPQKPYNEMRDEIKRTLFQSKRREIIDTAQEYWKNLKLKKHIELQKQNIDTLLAIMKPWKTYIRDTVLTGLANLPDSIRTMKLLIYDKGDVTVSEFQSWIKRVMEEQIRGGITRYEAIERMLDNLLMGDMLPELAEKKGLNKHPDVVQRIKRAYENRMIQLFIDQKIWGTIEPTEDQLLNYYQEHIKDKYTPEKNYKIQEIVVEHDDLANEIARWAKQGRPFSQLVSKYSIKPGKEKNKGIEEFRRGRKPQHANCADSLKIGEIGGPIKLSPNRYSVFKYLDLVQPDPQPFEEVKKMVRVNLINEIKDQKKAAWLEETRKNRNDIKINDNQLVHLLDEYYRDAS
jgi:peptidyl-prolyl cis-trans isomerase C